MTSEAEPRREQPKSALESFLSLFAEVKGGEGLTAIILTFDVLLLLTAYYVLKVVREPLILSSGPGAAQVKSYATAAQAVLLIFVFYGYREIARRFGRIQLVTITMLFFASNLAVFFVLSRSGVPVGIPFYLWLGCFSLTVIAQFWSFANDVYTPEQGKRLFAIVGIGSVSGAVVGSLLSKALIKPLGPYLMMLVAGAILLACLGLTYVVHLREGARKTAEAKANNTEAAKDEPVAGKGGLSMLLSDRYLMLIGLVILVLNLINTNGEFILSDLVSRWASSDVASKMPGADPAAIKDATEKAIGSFYADQFLWVNVAGMVMQFFVVSRVFKYFGLRLALFSLPVIALGAYGLIVAVPVIGIVRWVKLAENSTDYSLYNTVKAALWLPTTREQKFVGKQAVDTFIVRAGDMISGGIVYLGSEVMKLDVRIFALINVALVVVWLVFVVALSRQRQIAVADQKQAEAAQKAAAEKKGAKAAEA